MAPKTRLDRVVSLRETAEDQALAALGARQRETAAARERVADCRAAALADARRAEDAVLWALDDGSRKRLLLALKNAEAALAAAERVEELARAEFQARHQATEAVRRGADRKRSELVAEEDRRERRGADEVAALRHARGEG
jgi:flagellar biosynthesis chaperone FliJ